MIENEKPFSRTWIEENLLAWEPYDDTAHMKCYGLVNADFLIVLVWDKDGDMVQFSDGSAGLELRMPLTDTEFEVFYRLAARDFPDWPKLNWRKK